MGKESQIWNKRINIKKAKTAIVFNFNNVCVKFHLLVEVFNRDVVLRFISQAVSDNESESSNDSSESS